MRIGIQGWGSEGDIRPLLALGAGLRRRGHQVELVYTDFEERHFEAAAASFGVEARAVAMPVIADDAEMTRVALQITASSNPLTQSRIIVERLFNPIRAAMYEAGADLCARCDLVIGHFFMYTLRAAAERAGVPEVSVMLSHSLAPSRHIHPPGTPRLGQWGNVLEWQLARAAVNWTLLPEVNAFRASLGLAPARDLMTGAWVSSRLHLVAVSPTLCPRPPDWPPSARVSGFLELPATREEPVPAAVEAFLQHGAPPVYMGFGSMLSARGPLVAGTVELWREAAGRAGCRAILQVPAGCETMAPSDDRLLLASRLPHAAVFPRCAAVVHHMGAGTTHSALKAGVPSVPVPHVADQYFWADELRRLGVASRAITRPRLTAAALAARIREVTADPRFHERARTLAGRIAAEDGVGTAVTLIEQLGRGA